MKTLALLALLCLAGGLSACSQTSENDAQTLINDGCAAAPLLDAGASATTQQQISTGCTVEQKLAPDVAPLITAPAATTPPASN